MTKTPRSDATAGHVSNEAEQFGLPFYSRRLTDKILAAYNHALALEYVDVAASLLDVLRKSEAIRTAKYPNSSGPTVLELAGLWQLFIAAKRDFFNAASAPASLSDDKIAELAERTAEAYQMWSKYGTVQGKPGDD